MKANTSDLKRKLCPACKKWILVNADEKSGTCEQCGVTYTISHTLSDTAYKGAYFGIRLWVPKELRA